MVFVFSNPRYASLAILLAFALSTFIYFSINANFYWPLLTSSLPILDKFSTIGMLITSMLLSYFKDLNGILLLILSIIQGVALALLIYNFRNFKDMNKKAAAGGGLAAIAAVIGLGCVPCGTSILIPIMTLIFSSSAYTLLDTANLIILGLATLLSFYSVYKIGLIVYINKLTSGWKKEENHEKVQ